MGGVVMESDREPEWVADVLSRADAGYRSSDDGDPRRLQVCLRKVAEEHQARSSACRGLVRSMLPLPTFSGGIVQFEPGERPERLLERAEGLVYHARRAGKDAIRMDTPARMQAVPRTGDVSRLREGA
ncbi:hypothetical protein [Arhodomonas sp. AD133]|uniref:hypothetical protein n=1 Tax=Arhodomonas sp. AD133 TaxID=3415009 RepID=UPI003EB713FF